MESLLSRRCVPMGTTTITESADIDAVYDADHDHDDDDCHNAANKTRNIDASMHSSSWEH